MKKLLELIHLLKVEYILLTKFGPIQRKWLRFLRANPDKQGRKALGNKEDGVYRVCCLGQFGLMVNICKWEGNRLYAIEHDGNLGSMSYPDFIKMRTFGFYSNRGGHKDDLAENSIKSLAYINDTSNWLDVFNTCINDPKEYFSKKV